MTVAFPAVLNSEWTKIRTVSSTVWTLAIAVIATVGFGAGFCALISSAFDSMPEIERATFDPTLMSFSGMQFGQLAMIVFGVLVVSTEYSTGMIRSSLAAVPGRGGFLLGKLTVATVLALLVGLLTSFTAFFVGQAILGEHGIGIGQEHVLRAVIGSRRVHGTPRPVLDGRGHHAAQLGRLDQHPDPVLPDRLEPAQRLRSDPEVRPVPARQGGFQAHAGRAGRHGPRRGPYGPWGGLAIMLVWVAASVLGGYVVLRKRDA